VSAGRLQRDVDLMATPTGVGVPPACGGLIIPPTTGPLSRSRGLMMPTRKRTRAQDRRYRITHERQINETHLAEERRKYQAWLAATYEPPPF
jgi:hypothetical protein